MIKQAAKDVTNSATVLISRIWSLPSAVFVMWIVSHHLSSADCTCKVRNSFRTCLRKLRILAVVWSASDTGNHKVHSVLFCGYKSPGYEIRRGITRMRRFLLISECERKDLKSLRFVEFKHRLWSVKGLDIWEIHLGKFSRDTYFDSLSWPNNEKQRGGKGCKRKSATPLTEMTVISDAKLS